MRRQLAIVSVTAALVMAVSGSLAAPASATTEEYLFSVQAANGRITKIDVTEAGGERFRLTLSGTDAVTMFSDRPFRDARLMSPHALDANWDDWFAGDPPNAVLTFSRPGQAPASMVVELTNPTYSPSSRTLSFTATRLPRVHDPVEKGANWQRPHTPTLMRDVSLFIDMVTGTTHQHSEPMV